MTNAAIDHLVLPTADLATARARLTALGFTVAPEGVHPFGTANCCVYFDDGTFLEPLAVQDAGVASTAIARGNVFVARDEQFRQHRGDEGISALVLKTGNAGEDDERFRKEGISAGPMLDFERPVIDADGNSDIAAFQLAFAADPRSPSSFFFTCERVRAPSVDRAGLQRHANGVRGITGIAATALEPFHHADFFDRLLGAGPVRGDQSELVWALGDARLTLERAGTGGLRLAGIRFGVSDIDSLAALFKSASIAYEADSRTLVVAPAPGQGGTFIFEAI